MQKFSVFLLCTMAFAIASAQGIKGDGHVTREERAVRNFDGIAVNGACHLFLRQGSSTEVIIETDENLHAILSTEVEEGTLVISQQEDIRKMTELNIYVTVKDLRKIHVYGACEIETEERLKSEQLMVGVYGASNMDLDLEVDQLAMEISGAGNAQLRGKAVQARFDIEGTGAIKAYDLAADMVDVNISGMGSAKVNAIKKLDVDISGMASVNYKGDPEVKKSISGLGSLGRE